MISNLFRLPKVVLFTLIIAIANGALAQTPVHIPDVNLKIAIMEGLGIEYDRADPMAAIVTDEDLATVNQIQQRNVPGPIYDLTGLEHAIDLRSLSDHDLPTDPGFIAAGNLGPIAGLEKLEVINLAVAPVDDLGPLAGLTSLRHIVLRNSNVSDLSPLEGLDGLNTLRLKGPIEDLSAMNALPGLREAILTGGKVETLPVLDLPSLGILGLTDFHIEDISALEDSNLPRLYSLILSRNQIENLDALSGLTGLAGLSVDDNNVHDISPISNLNSLRGLVVAGNPVSDFSIIAGLSALETIDISRTNVSDLAPLSGLQNLIGLLANDCGIENLEALTNLPSLYSLEVNRNNISDISALSSFTTDSRFNLEIADNNITDIRPLWDLWEGMPAQPPFVFRTLSVDVSGNPVDFSPGTEQYAVIEAIEEARGFLLTYRRWAGRTIRAEDEGWVDTGALMGWIYPQEGSDWILPASTMRWMYAPEATVDDAGAWAFFVTDGSGHPPVTEGSVWAGFSKDEQGNVDTGALLGWIIVPDDSGWIFSWNLSRWLYVPESAVSSSGAWVYLIDQS